MELSNKTPGQLANYLLELAAEYGRLSDELVYVLELKDIDLSIIRDQVNSDKQAEHEWGKTTNGINERRIVMKLKDIKVQMSSIKEVLRVKENEARSLY
jgi:hypothetical protein